MIHETAIVDSHAEIHPTVEIGPWCVIGPQVKIGAGTKLQSHVVLDGWTQVGSDNVFYPFSVIGAIPQDKKYKGEATKLIIGNGNIFREGVTVNLGTVQGGSETRIGDHNLLMAYSHVGHDCVVGSHCILANFLGLAGHVALEDHCNLTGMVGVSQFVRVGAYTYIGGQSGLERDIPPYVMAFGSRPCQIRGANIVGLRRNGFRAEEIQIINEAVKLWIRPEVSKDQCLLEIESQYGDSSHIQRFLKFIRESKVGVAK